MRSTIIVTILTLTGLLAAAPAWATAQRCTTTLLQDPAMMSELRLTPEQTRLMQQIQQEAERRRAELLSHLAVVRGELEQSYQGAADPSRLIAVEQSLSAQYDAAQAEAAAKMVGLMTPWQRARCSGVVFDRTPEPPPPAVVTVRVPRVRIVHKPAPVPRVRIVHKPAPVPRAPRWHVPRKPYQPREPQHVEPRPPREPKHVEPYRHRAPAVKHAPAKPRPEPKHQPKHQPKQWPKH